jgi:16S rRNA processing protein RimM
LNNPSGSKNPSPQDDFIALGAIVRPHGLKGEVKVRLTCSGLDRIVSCQTLRLVSQGREIKRVTVGRAFLHPDGDAILRLKEVKGVEEAESLRGALLAVLASEKAPLPPDTYFLDDLLGMTVFSAQGQELGQIEEVLEGPGNGVCVVRKGEKEILLPALKSVILQVDLKARKMVVELPEVIDGDNAD